MFRWFRDRRRDIKFTHCFAAEAQNQFDAGVISHPKLKACLEAADNPEVMRQARSHFSATDGRLGGISDWDWESIKQWFIDYFIPAMKVILPLVIMLLDENPTPDEE